MRCAGPSASSGSRNGVAFVKVKGQLNISVMASVISIGFYVIRNILYFIENTPVGREKIIKVDYFC